MCRVLIVVTRVVLSIMGVVGATVMAAPACALSHEEWVMAFVRFVDWPAPPKDDMLLVCQPLNAPPLALQGAQVRGLKLQVVRVSQPRDVDRCQVFSGLALREAEWAPWLAALKDRPILVVGQGSRFCELGASVCLVKDEASGVEKYQLNLDSLSRAGFNVRSQLLRMPRSRAAPGE